MPNIFALYKIEIVRLFWQMTLESRFRDFVFPTVLLVERAAPKTVQKSIIW